MKYQYGQLLTLFALCVATRGSSVEDVLAGMSHSEIENFFNDLRLDDTPFASYDSGVSDYDDYKDEAIESALPETDLNDVPKTQPAVSQGSPATHGNTMLPAYCDPPNPCPIGYTSADGCIEDFENTSEFSRRYQATQKCICDTEHMFDCPEENAHRGPDDIAAVNILQQFPGLSGVVNTNEENNPYLDGQKLPVHAKKGIF